MGIKLSGMASGLDTDAIVKELMSAQTLKKTKIENKKTTLNWKQEIWQDLNTKLLALYRGTLTKVKTQGSYSTKKVSSSNEAKVTASASNNAAKGAHTLEVKQLASAQYLTGGVISKTDGGTVSSTTKLKDLGITENTVITIQAAEGANTVNGSNVQKLTVGAETTISDFVQSCQDAGLNANFDATQKRLFISSSNSGTEQKFSITTSSVSADLATDVASLKKQTGYNNSTTTSAQKTELDKAYKALATADASSTEYQEAYNTLVSYAEKNSKTNYEAKLGAAKTDYSKTLLKNAYEEKTSELLASTVYASSTDSSAWLASEDGQKWLTDNEWTAEKIADDPAAYDAALSTAYASAYKTAHDETFVQVESGETYAAYRETTAADVSSKMAAITAGIDTTNDYEVVAGTDADVADAIALIKQKAGLESTLSAQVAADKTAMDSTITSYIANSVELEAGQTADGNSLLTKMGLAEVTGDTEISTTTSGNVSGLTLVTAKNSRFVLDGATMEESSNNFTVNYITLDLKGTTDEGSPLKITVDNDTSSTYDMVKSFVKEYNDILKKMNDLYGATPAKGYEPLSSEQKEAMTEDEIEQWETKIKDSLLRRDDTLSGLINTMRSSMMGQITINGKNYSLSSFGIKTSSDYTEKGLLHIYGDSEDSLYATEDNKLKEMLEADPDAVMKGLSKITQTLYDDMNQKLKGDSQKSSMKFYNDKDLDKQNTSYKKQITDWESKLSDMEERYYKQFTRMETALSKLNNQSNSLASLMGTNS